MPRIVDLSQEIYTGMMVYPGHLKTVLFDHATHAETAPRFDSGFSFQTKGFLLNDNGPTHVDSFSHLDPDPSAETIDQMPLDLFYGDAVCVDVTGAEPRTDIPVSRVEQGLADAAQEVRAGDILLFYTGTATKYGGTPEYVTEFPGLSADVADWIVEKGVKSFGIDTCTPDNPSSLDLSDPHDGARASHHPLREPHQPRSGCGSPVHLHRPAAQAEGRARGSHPCGGVAG